MATLQKFKILATQCGVAQSPTRSPRTSPLVQLPRKKTTLRMLLTRSTSTSTSRKSLPSCFQKEALPSPKEIVVVVDEKKKRDREGLIAQSHSKLKDLFLSSFEEEEQEQEDQVKVVNNENGAEISRDNNKSEVNRVLFSRRMVHGPGGVELGLPRPVWVGFRHRPLLRKAWRPMLVTIPE